MILGPARLANLIQLHQLVSPYYCERPLQNSADLRIAQVFRHEGNACLIPGKARDIGKLTEVPHKDCIWHLDPDTYYIGETIEMVHLPSYIAAIGITRSTMFRSGIMLSIGFIDPGYNGHIHFGFKTPGPGPTDIGCGYPVMQLIFMLAEPAAKLYDGAYQGGRLTPKE